MLQIMEYLPSLQQEFDEHKPSLFGSSPCLSFLPISRGDMESLTRIRGTAVSSYDITLFPHR